MALCKCCAILIFKAVILLENTLVFVTSFEKKQFLVEEQLPAACIEPFNGRSMAPAAAEIDLSPSCACEMELTPIQEKSTHADWLLTAESAGAVDEHAVPPIACRLL